MNKDHSLRHWQAVFRVLVMLLVPFTLLMFSIRLVMIPGFAKLEYSLPNFPPDSYGFTRDQRLEYSYHAITYLTNDAGISYLGELRMAEGAVFNERELSHMEDVKGLVQGALNWWYLSLTGLAVCVVFAWRANWWRALRAGLAQGAYLLIGLIAAAIMMVLIDFNWLFTEFHHLFFEGDTWLFYYSDSLIRLFPMRFWRDAFILVFVITLGGAGALIVQEKRAAKAENRRE
ncbi:MAG: TIGR01906 family membrane protein [Anaerolineaceae bacterium]|nr:TIGR01906 family membrane protein [Anaerolineaceae bacterium]